MTLSPSLYSYLYLGNVIDRNSRKIHQRFTRAVQYSTGNGGKGWVGVLRERFGEWGREDECERF